MTTRQQVVDEARRWVGTPYLHQGRQCLAGVDCGGLVGGIALALGLVPAQWWQTFDAAHGGYGRHPAGGLLQRICDSFMQPAEGDPGPADVLLLRFAVEPQHLGIAVPRAEGGLNMIHALSTAGRVVEHRLAPVWMARIVRVYRMQGVT